MKTKGKQVVIVLDLDQTIVHTISDDKWFKIHKMAKESNNIDLLNRIYEIKVDDEVLRGVIRDHTDEFLDYTFSNFIVGIWSAGVKSYVDAIVDRVFTDRHLHFIYSREDCRNLHVNNDELLCKPLEYIFYHRPEANRYNTILIDDRSDITYFNRLNCISIPEFIPSATNKDNKLLKLIHHFKQHRVSSSYNVQTLRSSPKLIFN
jgi:TFIIF-interacting CTD phosphatase-like protein